MKMKISIPLSNDNNFSVFSDIKEEIFYFGTILKEVWNKTNYNHFLFNRRFYPLCYFDNLNKVKEALEFLKNKKNTIRYTVNHSYPEKYKSFIKKELELLLDNVEIDELIIEDLDLVEIVEKYGKKIFLSTRLGVINKEEAKFFHKLIGKTLKGFILPRQLVPSEINEINKYCVRHNLELEYFFELGGCLNEERFCFFHEFLDFEKNIERESVLKPICLNLLRNLEIEKRYNIKAGFGSLKDFFICRACPLYFIENKENMSLKIVGRCFLNTRNKKIYEYAKLVKINLQQSKNFEEFKRKNILAMKKIFNKICNFQKCPYAYNF